MGCLGKGIPVFTGAERRGVIRLVRSPQDVMQVLREPQANVIVLVEQASATSITPLFSRIAGVICTHGGSTSHLALVAKEYELPCIMGFQGPASDALDGRRVTLQATGEVWEGEASA